MKLAVAKFQKKEKMRETSPVIEDLKVSALYLMGSLVFFRFRSYMSSALLDLNGMLC